MAKMGRIIDGVVSDVIVPVEGFTFQECFHPDVLAQYVIVADDAEAGWAEADAIPSAPAAEVVTPPAEEAAPTESTTK